MKNDDKLIKIIKNNEYINIMYDKSDANVEKKDYEIAIELYKSFKLLFPTEMRYIEDAGLTDSFFIFLKNHAFQFQYQNSSIFRMHLNDFFTMHNKLKNAKQLLAYSPSLFPLDKAQQIVLDTFGLDNLKKFELETGIFSHNFDMFEALSFYLIAFLRSKNEIVYNNELSYDEFTSLFAVYLNNMRKFEVFHRYPDYGWMDGEFREKHPEIFIDNNAPEELKKAFYKGEITLGVLQGHEEYIPFLLEKDLSVINDLEITIVVGHTTDESNYLVPIKNNFIEEYTNRYGKEKMLKLLVKYGPIINNLELSAPYNEIDDPGKIEQVILDEMYYWIVNSRVNYYYLIDVPEFREKYPDLFINFDKITTISYEEKARLTKSFYDRELKFEDIRKYPELKDILVDKNLFVAFGENLQVGKKLL